MSYPSALKGDPKVIFFTDFDGTISIQDSNDHMTDNLGFGVERRRELNIECLEGTKTFRDIFREMLDSVAHHPFDECLAKLVAEVELDPHFAAFYDWAEQNNVPVIILSSGMTPVIRALMRKVIGDRADTMPIICNEKVDTPDGRWTIAYHDASDFGHDKSLTIRPYAEHFDKRPGEPRPTMLYAGDGVSDLSAARETDLLFAKRGRDLVTYCEREKVPFTLFDDWSDIFKTTKEIFEGKISINNVAKEGAELAKNEEHEKETTK